MLSSQNRHLFSAEIRLILGYYALGRTERMQVSGYESTTQPNVRPAVPRKSCASPCAPHATTPNVQCATSAGALVRLQLQGHLTAFSRQLCGCTFAGADEAVAAAGLPVVNAQHDALRLRRGGHGEHELHLCPARIRRVHEHLRGANVVLSPRGVDDGDGDKRVRVREQVELLHLLAAQLKLKHEAARLQRARRKRGRARRCGALSKP
eukprot:6184347-Pleurochrysis_carterae.AAC.3